MKELLDKISSYNLFNYLFPGVIFVIIGSRITHYQMYNPNILLLGFECYFIGIVISRVGSLVVEGVLKKLKVLEFAPYKSFVEASIKDPKVELLSEVNNTFRTLCSLMIVLVLLKLFEWLEQSVRAIHLLRWYILLVLLLALFVSAYFKQTGYVRKRVLIVQSQNTTDGQERKG